MPNLQSSRCCALPSQEEGGPVIEDLRHMWNYVAKEYPLLAVFLLVANVGCLLIAGVVWL